MRVPITTWLPPVVAFGLFAVASIVTGIYYGNTWAISYATPISVDLLWAQRASLTLASLREAWSTGRYDWTFVFSVIAWPVLLSRRSHQAACVAAAIPVAFLFPINVVGVYMAGAELLFWRGWDGETLAEGWPLVELYGVWSLWALAFLIHRLNRAPHNNALQLTKPAQAMELRS